MKYSKIYFHILLPLCFFIGCAAAQSRPDSQIPADTVARVAVLATTDELVESRNGDEIFNGMSRTAQEFEGVIIGREQNIAFGDKLEIKLFSLPPEHDRIEDEIRKINLDKYDIVFGFGFMFGVPFINAHRDFSDTHFVIIDYENIDPGLDKNLTSIVFNMSEASFMAGVVAGHKMKGAPLGFIGGKDFPLIRDDFLQGFREGVEYIDSVQNTKTELLVEFAGTFSDKEAGYDIAKDMYESGVSCIFQAAGYTGMGVLEAAGAARKWVIGVDIDQGLKLAGESYAPWILTSAVKRWGRAFYLVCREFLTTGLVPAGTQMLGLNEKCVGLALNPYNTPNLMDQLSLIESVRSALEKGEVPSAALPQDRSAAEGAAVWKSPSLPLEERISLTVNNPVLSHGVDAGYRRPLRNALNTAFFASGRYRVINQDQKDRLLEEISSSLEMTSDEKEQLEVGRLIAAEVIVFVDVSLVGKRYRIDTKIVDVQTGITRSAVTETFQSIDAVFENIDRLVSKLNEEEVSIPVSN